MTLYNAHHQFHINPANRYAVGSLTPLKFNADGSLDIIIQPEPPDITTPTTTQTATAHVANWLPSPSHGPFKLYMRLYQPHGPALEGTWIPPAAMSIQQKQAQQQPSTTCRNPLPRPRYRASSDFVELSESIRSRLLPKTAFFLDVSTCLAERLIFIGYTKVPKPSDQHKRQTQTD